MNENDKIIQIWLQKESDGKCMRHDSLKKLNEICNHTKDLQTRSSAH